ncbi:hypothetical protein Q5752_001679 [Cryptotrichosporon argae]
MDDLDGEMPSKKRRNNVAKACVNCRRRKTKCDGAKPTCGTCAGYRDECAWDEDDGRRPASRAYVQSLRDRIRVLETALGERITEVAPGLSPDGAGHGVADVQAVTGDMLHLQMGNHGEEVYYHGPTSAYAHATSTPILKPSAAPSPPAPYPDWTQSLPSLHPLTFTFAQHSLVLDRFFRFFASWGLRAHLPFFMRDMHHALSYPAPEALGRTAHYSPLLHNVVLAIGLAFADEEQLRADNVREMFVRQAKRYLDEEIVAPSLASVQALALLSSYYSTKGSHSVGYAYMGMAERTAISLGLNVDCSALVRSGRMSQEEMMLRNNTFWTVFIQEQCWSIYVGRPHTVANYNSPLPIIDTAFDQAIWSREDPAQHCMLSSAFVETAKLSVIMQDVMSIVYSLKADRAKLLRDAHVSALSLELDTWHEQLPSPLALTPSSTKNALPHVIMLHLAWEWLVILVWRPFYGGQDETAIRRCDRSADHILSLLRTYHTRFNLHFSPPSLINVAFTAGTTFLLSASHHRSPKIRTHAVEGAKACVDLLRAVKAWQAAADQADILEKLVDAHIAEQEVCQPDLGQANTGAVEAEPWVGISRWADLGFTFGSRAWARAGLDPRLPEYWVIPGLRANANNHDVPSVSVPSSAHTAQFSPLSPTQFMSSPTQAQPTITVPTLPTVPGPGHAGHQAPLYSPLSTGTGMPDLHVSFDGAAATYTPPEYTPPLDPAYANSSPWFADPQPALAAQPEHGSQAAHRHAPALALAPAQLGMSPGAPPPPRQHNGRQGPNNESSAWSYLQAAWTQ